MYTDPPYFLLIASLLASIASGVAFDAVLRQSVMEWSKSRSSRTLATLQGTSLKVPYLGIVSAVVVFLASGVEFFGFPTKIAYAISLPLTMFIAWLVWTQLGRLLAQLERGGSQALDLDSF